MFRKCTTGEDLGQLLEKRERGREWRPSRTVVRLQDLKPPEIPECLLRDPGIVNEVANGVTVAPAKTKKGEQWLKSKFSEFEARIPGLSWNNFSESLIQLLLSGQSNERLQNELAELLGFDAFELILEVLQDREQIIKDFIGDQKQSVVAPKSVDVKEERVIKTYAVMFLVPGIFVIL